MRESVRLPASFSLDAFKSGDRKHFTVMFNEWKDAVTKFCQNITKHNAEAGDITNESFVRLWKNREVIESVEGMRDYLFITARNLSYDYLRRKQRERARDEAYRYLSETSLDELAPMFERALAEAAVMKWLIMEKEKLPRRCKEVFDLIYYYNYPIRQIAEALNVTEKTVRAEKSIAVKILKNKFKQMSKYLP